MDLLSVIRRWRFRQGMPIREIVRRTGLSRNTIRKYLRADTLALLWQICNLGDSLFVGSVIHREHFM